ncbi:MAG: class II histone deacetylase [Gammaproteobacteria bacterium]|nr:class II histone deacetylase [Gammaproteobacteria bacterium]MCP5200356.1 class II histone deacetylase [Gammaproteobacteria bacterium]
MSTRTAFFHDERCLWHSTAGLFALVAPVGGWVQPPAGAGLAESPESKRRAVSLLQVSGLAEKVDFRSAPLADEEDLLRVHPADYLEKFKALSDAGGGELGPFAPFGPGSYEIAKVSAGLAIAAVDTVVAGQYRNAYSMSRPPSHHCLPDQPMGFCLLANISIAIEAAKAKHGVERVVVLDWDVHHGNGTQAVFYERDDVFTISLHQENCFPPGYSGAEERGKGRGEGFNMNIPLLPGGGDAGHRYAMQRMVLPAIERYRPDLIVIASGYDANGVDPLARMLLHSESFRWLTHEVMALADKHCDGRLVVVHEGGYAESYVPFCVHAVVEAMSGERTDVVDPMLEMFQAWQPNARFEALQREMIDEMAGLHGL